ncbi:hypothetical protein ZIOFF_044007 [Zingiber officinale]|uniref:Uncharacterized protein n=1 Tax=Zingiber officinale TaxID=94328 RepID=A0A8J5G5B6_ZINOF|nr:hypothetical protein ZIOFF_044007 [Zingiber officinale]
MAEASGDDGRQLDSIPSGNSGKMLLEWLCPMGVVAATVTGAPTASLPHSAPFFATVACNPHAAEPCARKLRQIQNKGGSHRRRRGNKGRERWWSTGRDTLNKKTPKRFGDLALMHGQRRQKVGPRSFLADPIIILFLLVANGEQRRGAGRWISVHKRRERWGIAEGMGLGDTEACSPVDGCRRTRYFSCQESPPDLNEKKRSNKGINDGGPDEADGGVSFYASTTAKEFKSQFVYSPPSPLPLKRSSSKSGECRDQICEREVAAGVTSQQGLLGGIKGDGIAGLSWLRDCDEWSQRKDLAMTEADRYHPSNFKVFGLVPQESEPFKATLSHAPAERTVAKDSDHELEMNNCSLSLSLSLHPSHSQKEDLKISSEGSCGMISSSDRNNVSNGHCNCRCMQRLNLELSMSIFGS